MQIAKISNIADGKHHHNKLWSLRHHSQSLSFSVICSVRSSNSHSDLLLIHHPLFSDHNGPRYWTFTFWATTAISKAITGLICWLHVYCIPYVQDSARQCKTVQYSAR